MRSFILFTLITGLFALGCDDSGDGGTGLIGEMCTSGDQCASALCAGGMCSQQCDPATATSCPEGFTCTPASGLNVCLADTMSGGTMAGGTMAGGTMAGGTMAGGHHGWWYHGWRYHGWWHHGWWH